MAREILSRKMQELDRKLERLHSRIQTGETADRGWIRGEAEALRRECAEEEQALRDKLQHSKCGVVARLSEAYGQSEQVIRETREALEKAGCTPGDGDFPVEEKLLVAEYALDFAVQAADRALLIAMEAMDAYLSVQEEEEN